MLLNRAWRIQHLTPALTVFPGALVHKMKDGLEDLLGNADNTQPSDFKPSLCMCVFLHVRAGWVDCWSVPNFLLIIDYTWHPIYPQKADEQLKQSRKLAASVLWCYPLLCESLAYVDTVDVVTTPFWCHYQFIFWFLVEHDVHINLHVLCVWSVRDGRIHFVSSAPPWARHCLAAFRLCFYFCCSPPSVYWPLRAAPWQTSCRDGNVTRFSNHPLWSTAQSSNIHQGTRKFDQSV